MVTVGFIGAGNMATAIIRGIAASKMEVRLFAYDVNPEKAEALSQYGVTAVSSPLALAQSASYLVLAVKPQQMDEALQSISEGISTETVIISIAAGITAEWIESRLRTTKVIQAMPNTPLLMGLGATALSRSKTVSDKEFSDACSVFGAAGITREITEDKMNEIIPVNASAPAFIYQFAQCFMEYGQLVGLDSQVCLDLFAQTLTGSAKMLTESGYSVTELIEMVSSKGGTTIAGLTAMKENGFDQAVLAACKQCTARAYKLTRE